MPLLGKELGRRWAQLNSKNRLKYKELALIDKQQHAADRAELAHEMDPISALREGYAHLIPKHPPSVYWMFSRDDEQRAAAEASLRLCGITVTMGSLARKLSEMWHEASSDVKAKFTELRNAAIAEYQVALKAWQASPQYAELQRRTQELGVSACEATADRVGKKRSRSNKTIPADEVKAFHDMGFESLDGLLFEPLKKDAGAGHQKKRRLNWKQPRPSEQLVQPSETCIQELPPLDEQQAKVCGKNRGRSQPACIATSVPSPARARVQPKARSIRAFNVTTSLAT